MLLRTLYLSKRVVNHMRHMDFSITPGWSGYAVWRTGAVTRWRNRHTARYPKPQRPAAMDRMTSATASGRSRLTLWEERSTTTT